MLDAGYPWPEQWEPMGEPPSWPLPNVWLGVSVENQQWADIRVRALLGTPAAVRFLSCEPLLGPVDLAKAIEPNFAVSGWKDLSGLDWVIVGGESGRGARPMHPDWARSLRDQCTAAGVAFHFKQWGEWVTEDQSPEDIVLPATSWNHLGDGEPSIWKVGKGAAGRELDGRTWDEFPTVAVA
jgi:protein gp37